MEFGSPSGLGFVELMENFIEVSVNVQKFTVASLKARTSNGYADYIFRRAALDFYNVEVDSNKIEFKIGKNKDFRELIYEGFKGPGISFSKLLNRI